MGAVIHGLAERGASAGSELIDHGTERDRCFADLMRSAQDGDHAAYVLLLEDVTLLLRQTVRRHRHFLQPADVARSYVRRSANEVAVEQLPVTFAEDEANVSGDAYGDPEALRQAMHRLP